jgi:hypothetical protein
VKGPKELLGKRVLFNGEEWLVWRIENSRATLLLCKRGRIERYVDLSDLADAVLTEGSP